MAVPAPAAPRISESLCWLCCRYCDCSASLPHRNWVRLVSWIFKAKLKVIGFVMCATKDNVFCNTIMGFPVGHIGSAIVT